MRYLPAALSLMLVSIPAFADDQKALDGCIASWGKDSPFKKGTAAGSTVATGVKVFGVGSSQSGDDKVTDKPSLVLVRPAVNVMGKTRSGSPTQGVVLLPLQRERRGQHEHRGPLRCAHCERAGRRDERGCERSEQQGRRGVRRATDHALRLCRGESEVEAVPRQRRPLGGTGIGSYIRSST